MPAAVTCPFCSHEFRPTTPGVRTVCPRCGETFAPDAGGESSAVATADAAPAASGFRPFVAPAAFGVLLFAFVLTLGTYAIFNDQRNRPSPEAGPGPAAHNNSALQLDHSLGLLPPETNVVLAARPGLAPDGDLDTLLKPFGVADGTLAGALRQVGFDPTQVRSVVVGVTVPADNPIPRAAVVVSLKRVPANARDILAKFDAKPEGRAAGDARYRATLKGYPVFLRVIDPVTYLIATEEADIDRPPTTGRGHLSESLRDSLARWPADAALGLATGSADWSARPSVALAAGVAGVPDLAKRLAGVRAAVAVPRDTGVRVELLCADTPTVERLTASLPEAKADANWVTATLPPGAKLLTAFPPVK
jgi:hypothetical protein